MTILAANQLTNFGGSYDDEITYVDAEEMAVLVDEFGSAVDGEPSTPDVWAYDALTY